MYPSLGELLTAYNHPLPASLIATLNQRYNAHGMEYVTELKHTDGRVINQCMQKDSILDAQEELNDAIFNILVVCLKQRLGRPPAGLHPWKPRAALRLLVEAWETLFPPQGNR